MYQQTGAQGGQPGPDMGGADFGGQQPGGQSAGNGGNDDVVDADYDRRGRPVIRNRAVLSDSI